MSLKRDFAVFLGRFVLVVLAVLVAWYVFGGMLHVTVTSN